MTKDELDALFDVAPRGIKLVARECLTNLTPRTLVYGYFCNRQTMHIYLGEDGLLHRVVYDNSDLLEHRTEEALSLEDFTVDKRLYPERCDFEFCTVLKRHDVSLPFTTFTPNVEPAQFYGKRREELIETPKDFIPLHVSLDYKHLRLPTPTKFGIRTNETKAAFQKWLDEGLTNIASRAYLRMTQWQGYTPKIAEQVRGLSRGVEYWDITKRESDVAYPSFVMADDLAASLAAQLFCVVQARLIGARVREPEVVILNP
ncbi:hypothetical protein [Burkholderia cenocepacia]|uniref:hypothetical protein n=1 Tax=Burkholderia cenocepacia TaxID=95486 RepID=UPI00076123B3|nr:hypothetical protein [Burkholderia cenocepacia]KWU23396.1 hypothetical protein AS149_37035 [Burkholderia cenocepacia]